MKHYSVNLFNTKKYGYPCIEVRWNGLSSIYKKNKLIFTIYSLDFGLYTINDRWVECYDLDGAIEIAMFTLAKRINRRYPRSEVTMSRIQQNWK